MKVMTVVGARPNFMKAAPILAAIREHNRQAEQANAGLSRQTSVPAIDHVFVHTGQHHDVSMSDSFFADLDLPAPDVQLDVGSGSHAIQTAKILERFEAVLLRERPDVVVVVGDVNSTVACALVTAKISFDAVGTRPLLAHVEAGLRSFDRRMPEEINRIITDHVSDLLFVTEESGIRNLRAEGISPEAIHFVGNTMIDSLLAFQEKADTSTILARLGLGAQSHGNGNGNGNGKSVARYALLTLHRPSNVDNRHAFQNILNGLESLAADCPIVFPVHPRTQQRIKEFGLELVTKTGAGAPGSGRGNEGIILIDPLGYLDFVCLMKHAAIVITDSGGIQEETTCLGVPCVTVRENTERPVTVENGTNIVAGTTKEKIAAAIAQQMKRTIGRSLPGKWDGRAATRIVDVLIRAHRQRNSSRPSRLPQLCV